jgi:hypothetical protein
MYDSYGTSICLELLRVIVLSLYFGRLVDLSLMNKDSRTTVFNER